MPSPQPARITSPPGSDHAPVPVPVRTTYRRLRIAGLTPREAGTLTGHLAGLRVVPTGWTIEEVERLMFIRALVGSGRMGS
jgi:hypothetical protein